MNRKSAKASSAFRSPTAAPVRAFLHSIVMKIARLESLASRFTLNTTLSDSAPRLLTSAAMSENTPRDGAASFSTHHFSAKPLRPLHLSGEHSDATVFSAETQPASSWRRGIFGSLTRGIKRRWKRRRRRRKVGRAYDMALEIARAIPPGSKVLDVGCGNGFIAHHLSAMLGSRAVGIDLTDSTAAPIDFRRYDGAHFPVADKSFDAVLFCYVLHHAQDVSVVLHEMRRVLRDGGLAVIYEDIPEIWWDRCVCWYHNQLWRGRTGACTFRLESEWRVLFESFGLEIVSERRLSRWRNLIHPVSRRLYVLQVRLSPSAAVA